jgi:uncharacterized membrane protein YphA (DoxX/SURF4 family)
MTGPPPGNRTVPGNDSSGVTGAQRVSPPESTWRRVVPWLGTVARILLGVVFVAAGWTKVGDLAGSGRAVNAYQLMPFEAARVVGAALPFVEIAVGLLLLVGLATRAMAVLVAVLLAVYIFGISSVWVRGLSIDCGCFSKGGQLAPGEHPNYLWDLLRDIGLFAVAAFLVWFPRTRFGVDGWLLGATDGTQADNMDDEDDGAVTEDRP